MTDTTGPKISSCAMRIVGATSAKIVGSWKKPFAYCAVGEPRARRTASVAPSCRPISTYCITVSSCPSLTSGPIWVAGSRPSPTRSAARPRDEAIEERPVHLLVHDDAAGGRAALAGRAEAAPQAAVDRQLEIRVVHDHDDVLAAHLEVHLLERRRRLLRHGAADLGRAGERHDANRVADEQRRRRRPRRRPVTRLTTPGGMPASSRILTKLTADSGVSVAGLNTTVLPQTSAGMIFHDGIAIGKFHGVMTAADAERLADRHRELVAQLGGHGLPVLAAPLARHEERHVDRFLHVAARLVENLAHLARHVAGERLLALGEELRGAKQHLGAPRRRARGASASTRARAASMALLDVRRAWTAGTGRSGRPVRAGLRFSNSSPEPDGTHAPSIKL